MGDEDLTPANYILKIKSMSGAERRGITAKKLIELIVATPSPDERQINIDTQLAQLQNTMNLISNIATANQAEITTLKNEKETLANEIKELKEKDAGDDNDNDVTEMKKEIDELRSQINEIDQYLRVNNLEFVGLLKKKCFCLLYTKYVWMASGYPRYWARFLSKRTNPFVVLRDLFLFKLFSCPQTAL